MIAATPSAAGDRRARREWLDALAASASVSAGAFRIAYAINQFINTSTGEAFPSQATIAARAGCRERNVRGHLEALQAAGWLSILTGRDRTEPRTTRGLHYRLSWPDQSGTKVPVSETGQSGNPLPVSKAVQSGSETVSNRHADAFKQALQRSQTGTGVPPNLREPINNRGAQERPPYENETCIAPASARLSAPPPASDGEDGGTFSSIDDEFAAIKTALARVADVEVRHSSPEAGEIDRCAKYVAAATGIDRQFVRGQVEDILETAWERSPAWVEPLDGPHDEIPFDILDDDASAMAASLPSTHNRKVG